MKQGLIIGLLIGLAAGYLVATALDEDPAERARKPDKPTTGETVVTRHTPKPEMESDTPREWTPPSEVKDTGTVTMDGRIFLGGKLLEARPVYDLRKTLEWARANRDWSNYRKAILELGVTGTPEAQALLVEIMGDDTLFMPGPWLGQDFYKFLKESEVEGILAGARARAEIDLKEKAGTRWEGRGWLSLVALHGGEEELDWIESLGTSRNRWMEVDKALAEGSRNPLAAERIALRIEGRLVTYSGVSLATFAQENPNAAFRASVNALPTTVPVHKTEIVRLLGQSPTEATLAEAASVLNGITEPRERMRALRAVDAMKRRGLDTSGFQPLLDDLRSVLEQAARGELERSDVLVSVARSTLEDCRCAWDEATLEALRGLAARPDPIAAEVLEKIEKKGAKGGWDPERG